MSADDPLIHDALLAPVSAIAYALGAAVARRWPGRHVLETEDDEIDLDTFLARVPCEVVIHPAPHAQLDAIWDGTERVVRSSLAQGHRTVGWDGGSFEVVDVRWSDGYHHHARRYFVGPSRAVVERFAARIAEIATAVLDDEVMVFANGCWQRSQTLRAAIRGATLANLVLPTGTADALVSDFRRFLGARSEYERFGVPWKRGVLFVGPPGNGKTHCVKALLNELGLPCLYVQSFEAPYTNPQRNVHQVFERARRVTPCALVLEDLDALVSDKTRSFFLNELDGFAANTGIVTIATTNHAERLDAAIVDRPSRFDRKYHFGLPAETERLAYVTMWNDTLEREARLDPEAVGALAAATDGFSYAYLKELVLSALVRWLSDDRKQPLAAVVAAEVASLRGQMATAAPDRNVRHSYVVESEFPEDE